MGKGRKLYGAAAFTHALKEYGSGESMQEGLNRLLTESKRNSFLLGVCYGLQSLWELFSERKNLL